LAGRVTETLVQTTKPKKDEVDEELQHLAWNENSVVRMYRKNALIMAFSLPAKVWNQKGYSSLKPEDSPLTPCECLFFM